MKKLLVILISMSLFIISGCSSLSEPPNAFVTINDKKIELSKGGYHWEKKGIFSTTAIIADAASPYQIAKELEVIPIDQASVADVRFSDHLPPTLSAYLWEEKGREKELPVNGTQITLPTKTGKYVIEVWAEWSKGNASYTFVVEVK